MPRKITAALLGLVISASSALASPLPLPKIEALIIASERPPAEVAQFLESESLVAGEDSYIIPISSGTKERLLERLTPIAPKLLADAEHQASTVAGSAVDLVRGAEAITLRIKAIKIKGERLAAWYGIKRSSVGNDAPTPISQQPFRVDLAYGEALVVKAGDELWAAFIPGPFDPETTELSPPPAVQPQTELDALTQPNLQTPPPPPDHPKIEWDAAPGATLPDQEALERILGR